MERTIFDVICKMNNTISFDYSVKTAHWDYERVERHNKIMTYIGDGKLIASFEVYTAHPNGNEIHNIFDNGVVLIQNIRTKKLITELIARPQQIRRYWEGLRTAMPYQYQYIIDKARVHQKNKWNEW